MLHHMCELQNIASYYYKHNVCIDKYPLRPVSSTAYYKYGYVLILDTIT